MVETIGFLEMVKEIKGLHEDEFEEYFEFFFTPFKYEELGLDQEKDELFQKSNRILFLEEGDLLERLEAAINCDFYNPYAFYASLYLIDPTVTEALFRKAYSHYVDDIALDKRRKLCLQFYLDVYCDFLMTIRNFTRALKVQELIKDAYKDEPSFMVRTAIIYATLEKADEFYQLYLEEDFKDPIIYVLLLIVLLKHERESDAHLVYNDLLSAYPCFEYIDHPWDIEHDESDETVQFFNVLEACVDDFESVPGFFIWCALNKEEVYQS